MKGIVLGYDTEAEVIVVRAEDGQRYRFLPADWRERQAPRRGDSVDFDPDGDHAREVYLILPARRADSATPPAPITVLAAWAPTRFFLMRPVFTCALLVLFACLLGSYAVGETRISLIEAPELISRMSESLDSLIAVSGTEPAPRLGAGVVRVMLALLLGLYAVPVLAALTAWREFVGQSTRRLARAAGLAAMILPIGLPLLIVLVMQVWVLPGIPEAGAQLGRSGVTTPEQVFEVLRIFTTGSVLLLFAGAVLWRASARRVPVPARIRASGGPAREVVRPKPTARTDIFAPMRARRAAAAASIRRAGMAITEFGSRSRKKSKDAYAPPPPPDPDVSAPSDGDPALPQFLRVVRVAEAASPQMEQPPPPPPPAAPDPAAGELPPPGVSAWPDPVPVPEEPGPDTPSEFESVPDDQRTDQQGS